MIDKVSFYFENKGHFTLKKDGFTMEKKPRGHIIVRENGTQGFNLKVCPYNLRNRVDLCAMTFLTGIDNFYYPDGEKLLKIRAKLYSILETLFPDGWKFSHFRTLEIGKAMPDEWEIFRDRFEFAKDSRIRSRPKQEGRSSWTLGNKQNRQWKAYLKISKRLGTSYTRLEIVLGNKALTNQNDIDILWDYDWQKEQFAFEYSCLELLDTTRVTNSKLVDGFIRSSIYLPDEEVSAEAFRMLISPYGRTQRHNLMKELQCAKLSGRYPVRSKLRGKK